MKIAIIGDNFMRAQAFEKAIRQRIPSYNDVSMDIKAIELTFPDEPVTQFLDSPEFSEVKEFQGNPKDIVSFIGDSEALITHTAVLTKSMLDKLPNLRFVGVSRGGPVNVDHIALANRGIRLVNTPGRNASAVAEFTVGVLIAESRNIAKGHTALMHGTWRGQLYRADIQRLELSRMTVGLIGYSHIGKRVADLLSAFGCKLLFCDPYVDLTAEDRKKRIEKVELEELLNRSDAVSLHLRATPETNNMINSERLNQMKTGALLINTARGSLVDEEALAKALASGKLSGAALDTFQNEPLSKESKLLQLDNVLLTPHIAGASITTVEIAAEMLAEELECYRNDQPPINAFG